MIAWERWRGHSGTQQYAYPGRGYYILHGVGWPDMMAPGAMAKNLIKVLDFGQPIEWFSVRG